MFVYLFVLSIHMYATVCGRSEDNLSGLVASTYTLGGISLSLNRHFAPTK